MTTSLQSALCHKKATILVFLIHSNTYPYDVIYIYYRERGYAHFIGWFLLHYSDIYLEHITGKMAGCWLHILRGSNESMQ